MTAVLIGGEAGIGKTSPLERFTQDLPHIARALWGACDVLGCRAAPGQACSYRL